MRKEASCNSESETLWSTENSSSQEDGMESVPIGDTPHPRPKRFKQRLKKARKNVTHFFQGRLSSLGPGDEPLLPTYEETTAIEGEVRRLFPGGLSETSASSSCGSGASLGEAGLFQNSTKMGTLFNNQPPSYDASQAEHPGSQRQQEQENFQRNIACRSLRYKNAGLL